jgi:hypothetical protein
LKSTIVQAVCLLLVLPAAAGPLEVISFSSELGEVSFPHKMHFNDMEMECATCHHETNAAKLDYPHEDYLSDFWIDCRICHRENAEPTAAQACDRCHHDASACESCADQTLSPKVVIHLSCWECHEIETGESASRQCKTCHAGPRSAWRRDTSDVEEPEP